MVLVRDGPNNFDAIRIAMALLVVWSHSFALYYGTEAHEPLSLLTSGQINAGNLGVYVFFMVSGFLITQSFERSKSPWAYLRKRVARIYPGYLVAVAICAFVILPLYAGTTYTTGTLAKTIGLNLLLQGYFVTEPFVHNAGHGVNSSLWSIPFEFWCYLGVLALGVLRLLPMRALLLAAYVVVTGLRVWADATGHRPGGGVIGSIIGWPYFWFRMAPCFMVGMIAYLYRDQIPRSFWLAVGSCGVLLIASHVPGATELVDVLMPPAIAYTVFYIAFGGHLPVARYGDFSYGTYLYAFPIQQLLVALAPMPFSLFVPASAALSLSAGALSWHTTERWFLRRRREDLRAHIDGIPGNRLAERDISTPRAM